MPTVTRNNAGFSNQHSSGVPHLLEWQTIRNAPAEESNKACCPWYPWSSFSEQSLLVFKSRSEEAVPLIACVPLDLGERLNVEPERSPPVLLLHAGKIAHRKILRFNRPHVQSYQESPPRQNFQGKQTRKNGVQLSSPGAMYKIQKQKQKTEWWRIFSSESSRQRIPLWKGKRGIQKKGMVQKRRILEVSLLSPW